jgi:ABC-type multidrug transport system ATPase subunit
MVEADVLCDHLALIDHGEIVVTGSPSEKRRISRLSVIEMQLRSLSPDLLNRLRVVPGVSDLRATSDGMLHHLVIQAEPAPDPRKRLTVLVDGAVQRKRPGARTNSGRGLPADIGITAVDSHRSTDVANTMKP